MASWPHHLNCRQVQNLQYHIFTFIFSVCCTEIYCTCWDKGVKYASPSAIGFLRYLYRNYKVLKGYLVYVPQKRKIIYSYDVVSDDIFSSVLAYTSQPYAEAMYMQPAVSYIPYVTTSREQPGDIITFTKFEEGDLLSETCDDREIGN